MERGENRRSLAVEQCNSQELSVTVRQLYYWIYDYCGNHYERDADDLWRCVRRFSAI